MKNEIVKALNEHKRNVETMDFALKVGSFFSILGVAGIATLSLNGLLIGIPCALVGFPLVAFSFYLYFQ